jgi:hypothetical protein
VVREEREAVKNLLQVHDLAREELGDGEADNVRRPLTSAMSRRTCALVRPPGPAPNPRTISSLSTVSTSKWTATREQPVAASHSSNATDDSRSSSGPNDRMHGRGVESG